MYQPGQPPIGRTRLIAVMLALGGVLSFGLGQALGHWQGAGTASPITRSAQSHQSATAEGSLGSASPARPSVNVQPAAAPPPRTESNRGGDAGRGQHGDGGKHGKAGEGNGPPKTLGDGGSTGSTGSDGGGGGGN